MGAGKEAGGGGRVAEVCTYMAGGAVGVGGEGGRVGVMWGHSLHTVPASSRHFYVCVQAGRCACRLTGRQGGRQEVGR